MPLVFGTSASTVPNLCMECGDQCRRPKRFCSDSHKELWQSGRGMVINHHGAAQVAAQRQQLGITPEALENRRKLSVSREF